MSPIGAEGSEERKHADQVFKYIIKPAMDKFRIKVVRSDEIGEPGSISKQMFERILGDDLCIALLTGHNPNVFYELAIAHAAKRPVIIMIQKGELLPFDIKDLRCVYYDFDPDAMAAKTYEKEVEAHVSALEEMDWKAESPIDLWSLGQKGRQDRFFETFAEDEVLIVLPPTFPEKVVPETTIHAFFGVMELQDALNRQNYQVRRERADRVGNDALNSPVISVTGPVTSRVSKFLLEQPEIVYRFGGPDGHAIINTKDEKVLVEAKRNGGTVARDYGILTRMRNPYNKERDAIVAAGCFGWGTQAALRVLTDPESLDFLGKVAQHFQVICTCLIDEDQVGTEPQLLDLIQDPSLRQETVVSLYPTP